MGSLVRLHRHKLSALAVGHALDARAFFATAPLVPFRFRRSPQTELAIVAKTTARLAQYWSVMEYLCGARAPAARRLAFHSGVVPVMSTATRRNRAPLGLFPNESAPRLYDRVVEVQALKAGLEVKVKRNSEMVGRLKVSHGTVVWAPKNARYG